MVQGFSDARRTQLFLRMAIEGVEGSGKSLTAMKIMHYLLEGGEFFAIDSEHGRMTLYAIQNDTDEVDPEKGRFRFRHLALTDFGPQTYIAAIRAAAKAGAKGLVIDGISAEWDGKNGILEQKNAKDRQGGNSYTNWGAMTELHNDFINEMMEFPGHLIVTMRSKTEYAMETNDRGKSVPKKVGLAPVQRDGISYEFDVIAHMDKANLEFTKMRDIGMDGMSFNKPGKDVADVLRSWLGVGGEMPMTRSAFIMRMNELGFADENAIAEFVRKHPTVGGPYKFNELVKLAEA